MVNALMKREDFNFILPKELIAQYPLANRTDSRLLTFSRKTGRHEHHTFNALIDFLEPGDLLVMNDSKVIPARLYGHKLSGGKVEFLVERMLDNNEFLAHIKTSKALKPGAMVQLDKGWQIEVLGRQEDLFHCKLNGCLDLMLHQIGHVPLPPYISREDEGHDLERYQTVYAKHKGSVAAPTAGLHFDEALMRSLKEKGIKLGYSTLHVGAGTFRPVKCDNVLEHKMHSERFIITEALSQAVNETKAAGGRVIAVGTTALRSLESAARLGEFKACSGETDIFIYPGYEFRVCDGLVTNFHLPESTLLMLVSAFIGHANAMALYDTAIAHEYRFFSYGDASLLL
jgi:S-adenosylmethionine:tRNA ribosyltransferase-isomerase